MGFEPMSSARKAKMIGRTTPTERILAFRVLQFNPIEIPALWGAVTRAARPVCEAVRRLTKFGRKKPTHWVKRSYLDSMTLLPLEIGLTSARAEL